MSKSKTLILVEGEKTDFKLMERLLTQYSIKDMHDIISYKTNIYSLYNTMFKGVNPSELDILAHLKSLEPDVSMKKLFDQRFSDILLIFDFDPQDSNFSDKVISEMVEYFIESTEMGKLYLNYPMVESFYHMKNIPDADYNTYTASLSELQKRTYKARVNAENRNKDYSKFSSTRAESSTVICQNIEKARLITNSNDSIPDQISLLKEQLAQLHSCKNVYVLCTCVFYIADYNPGLLI